MQMSGRMPASMRLQVMISPTETTFAGSFMSGALFSNSMVLCPHPAYNVPCGTFSFDFRRSGRIRATYRTFNAYAPGVVIFSFEATFDRSGFRIITYPLQSLLSEVDPHTGQFCPLTILWQSLHACSLILTLFLLTLSLCLFFEPFQFAECWLAHR